MSSYIPVWVKKDYRRFPRVKLEGGKTTEVLSTLAKANQEADTKAYAALMHHIREVDGRDHTVIMIQAEKEVGDANRSLEPGRSTYPRHLKFWQVPFWRHCAVALRLTSTNK